MAFTCGSCSAGKRKFTFDGVTFHIALNGRAFEQSEGVVCNYLQVRKHASGKYEDKNHFKDPCLKTYHKKAWKLLRSGKPDVVEFYRGDSHLQKDQRRVNLIFDLGEVVGFIPQEDGSDIPTTKLEMTVSQTKMNPHRLLVKLLPARFALS